MTGIEQTFWQLFESIPWAALTRALLLFLFGLGLATLAGRSMTRMLQSRLSRHHVALMRRLVFYTIVVIFALAAMREAGFAPGVFLGAAGILTVAIGFASQTSASNMISGLFLIVEKPFEIGNMIEVGGTSGEVVAIDMLSIKLRTPDNQYVRIPNETIIKSQVINRSRFPIRRLDLAIGIAYREDIKKVEDLLLKLADDLPVCLQEPKPFILVKDFGASSVDLQFSYWVPSDKVLEGRSRMMKAIKSAFDAQDIEIPFPHTSVYAGSRSEPFRIQLMPAAEPHHQQQETNNESG